MRMRGVRKFQAGGVNTPVPNRWGPNPFAWAPPPTGWTSAPPPAGAPPAGPALGGMASPPGGLNAAVGGAPGINQAAAQIAANAGRSAGAPPPVGGVGGIPPGAGAPGLNPAAIQQALAMRRGIGPGGAGQAWAGIPQGPPGGGLLGMGGVPPTGPAPAGIVPGAPPPGAGANFAAPAPQMGGSILGGLIGGGAGAPPAPAGPPAGAGLAGPVPGMPLPPGGMPPMMPPGAGFAKGGAVAEDGDTPAKKARSDRQWGQHKKAAEDIPEAPEKKAKGGVLKRKPKAPKMAKAKEPVPTPSPYDTQGPGGTPVTGPPPAVAPPVPGPMAGPPGMAKGGKWIQGAIKKPGALHQQLGVPQGEKIPAKKLAAAAGKGGKLGQRARLAQTLKGMHKNKGGKCDKMAAGGVAKVRKGFPNTNPKPGPKKFAEGGKVRGCGVATKGCGFSGIY